MTEPVQEANPQVEVETPIEQVDQYVEPAKLPKSNGPIILLMGLFVIGIITAIFFYYQYSQLNKTEEPSDQVAEQQVIGLSMSSLRVERWRYDRDQIIAEAEKRGMLVNVTDANDDDGLQISQAENLILQGVDVLIVIANNGQTASRIVEIAHEHNVKVIAYDRLILDSDLDYYMTFDSVEVGRKQAEGVVAAAGAKKNYAYIGGSETDYNAVLLKQGTMSVLEDKINSGEINLVLDVFITDWKQELAYKTMKEFLAAGGQVDAVIAANDGNASGVIQALKEYDLDGKVPVSGQDAEASALIRILEGTQTMTVYKPLKNLAQRTVELCQEIMIGQVPEISEYIDNGKIDVPTIYIPTVSVTKDNIEETVIKDGFHEYDEIFNSATE